jgi:hypothetical protein
LRAAVSAVTGDAISSIHLRRRALRPGADSEDKRRKKNEGHRNDRDSHDSIIPKGCNT